jgi:hypothetical protein
VISFTVVEVTAQPPYKAKERIKQMKKMKLLDILQLSEEEADKFIVKYSAWENKVEAQREEIDKISDELFELLKKESSTDEIQKQSAKLLSAQEKFFSVQMEKLKSMKDILSPLNYAKLLVFEDRFIKELGKRMMERKGDGTGGPGGRGRGR